MKDVAKIIKDYNSQLNRDDWNRSIAGMVNEWQGHNILYYLSIGKEDKERAKHVDLDEKGTPLAVIWK